MAQRKLKKVLITGANGFIGNSLMNHYKSQGIAVIGVDLVGNGEDIIQGDIGQPESISQQLQDCDVVIHTAALVSNSIPDEDMWRVNVLATRNLIAAANVHKVRRFVQLSSIVAYGNSAEGELDESHPVHADGGSYVLTKLASEHAVLAAATSTSAWINAVLLWRRLRHEGVYRPGAGWAGFALRLLLANGLMAAVVLWLHGPVEAWLTDGLSGRIERLLTIIVAAGVTYLLVLAATGLRPHHLRRQLS